MDLNGLNDLDSLISLKILLIMMVRWHPNNQYWPLFVEWIIKISFILLEAVEASRR